MLSEKGGDIFYGILGWHFFRWRTQMRRVCFTDERIGVRVLNGEYIARIMMDINSALKDSKRFKAKKVCVVKERTVF